jgi:hypothetical protein
MDNFFIGHIFIVIYEILRAVNIKITFFWDVTQCSSVDVDQGFGMTSYNKLAVIRCRPLS